MTQLAVRLGALAAGGSQAISFQDVGLPPDLVRDQV